MSTLRLETLQPDRVREKDIPLKLKCHHEEPHLIHRLGKTLHQHLTILDHAGNRTLVVVSIGTDRSTGDSLGPLVGTRLVEDLAIPVVVFGTLTAPVHATNLEETLTKIQSTYHHPIIIAIDACLGRSESVGAITLAAGALKPGAGVNKSLPQVGDVHFTGIVNVGGYMEYLVLQNTRLGLVWTMANTIAASIEYGVFLTHRYRQQKAQLHTIQ